MAPRKSQPITAEVAGLQFRFQTDDEVRNTSVVQITNPITYDNAGAPAPQGLYDARMGPTERGDTCVTCGLRGDDCPGHAGHIELMSPVIHPLLFGETFRALRSKCLNCHRFRAVPAVIEKTTAILSLLDAGHIVAAEQLRESADAFVDTLVASGELPASVRIANEGGKDTSEAGAVATRTVEMWSAVKMLVDQPAATSGVSSSHALHFRRQVVDEFFRSVPTSKCAHCGAFSPPLRRDGHSKIFQGEVPRARLASMKASGIDVDRLFPKSSESGKMHLLLPRVVLEELRHLWRKEKALCARVWNVSGAPLWKSRTSVAGYRSFVIHTVEVPPSACRPPLQFGGGSFEHPHNYALKQILNTNIQIVELHRKMREAKADADAAAESDEDSAPEPPLDAARAQERLIMLCLQLQEAVNSFCDASLGNGSAASAESTPGVRQLLEKKEGLFRKHMMGKRVNYAARSVISPDPYIGTDEIGIPEYFATRLSFPTPVTHINAAEMRQRVLNGPSVHPGALSVELPSGQLIDLATRTPAQRRAIAETLLVGDASAASAARVTSGEAGGSGTGGGVPSGMERRPKIVHRHLQNGDVLLVNRQPTLHKPGMMAHRVRVLPRQKTVRMHYANCNTYNADFDGDEINLHCPQDELARAELYTIANTDNQYIVPTSGAPLRGLIQDHIVAGVLLTQQGTLLEREAYMQLVYEGLVGAIPAGATITTVPPAILRPRALWTGKQVVSTVLLNLTRGQPPLTLRSKCKVPARQWGATSLEGELVIRNGILCTGVLEKSQFGASKFGLVHACFELYGARLAGVLLTTLGRLCTVFLQGHGFTCAMADLVLVEKADEDRLGVLSRAEIETAEAQKALLERLRAHSLESVLHDDTARAQLDALTKGRLGPVASDVISTCLPGGQQVPFPRNCMSLMTVAGAKGSIVNFSQISCLLGQQELEGRRVPVMPNGATLPTFAPHDAGARAGGFITQRFLTGVKPPEFFFHCMAGREGLVDTAVKTSRSGYLQRCIIKHLESLQVHYDRTVRDADGAVMQFLYGEDGVDVTRASYMGQFTFLAENHTACAKTCGLSRVSPEEAQRAAQLHSLSGDEADPLTASYDPSTTLGAVSAAYQEELDTYITKNPDGVLAASPGKVKSKSKKAGKSKSASDAAAFVAARRGRVPVEAFQGLMWLRYMRALVDPGEQVGVIAGQSIGEPSTQMTLNSVDYETRLALLWTAPHTPSEQLGASRASCTEALHVPSLPAAGGCVPAPAADGAIGAFIDALIDAHSKNVQWQDGNRTAYLALPPGAALALSPDEHGNMVWTPVEAVTRHPPVNRDGSNTLVRVRTRHGREVVVTRAKSLLVERNGLLVPIEGDQVRVGDRVPVAAALRTRQSDVGETRAVVSVLDLRSILPTSSVAFVPAPTNAPSSPSSSGATAARELPPVSRSVLNAEGECGGPALVVALLSAGVTCPALATATCVPALLPLTYGFGAFVGAYLAGGTLAQGRVCVRATDTANASSIASWARGVGARCALDACSVRVHSDIIALMVEHLCGRGENGTLRMPAIAAAAPLAFARGVLMNLVWDEVCESPRATVAQLWRESTAGSSTRSAVCRSSAVRDGAALVAARVWPHCSTRCVGDAAVEVAFGAKSDFHKSTLGDVLLDEIVALEDVASTHEFVYDLTVASTRNMCTMSGLGHRDTFHLAGTGKANVTLGIPRLREIIMTAAENIATPSLIAPIRTEVVPTVAKIMHAAAARSVGEAAARPLVLPPLSRGDTVALSTKERESAAALLRASLRPVRFSDIVGAVEVTERLGAHAGARVRVYDIEIELRGAAAVATGAAELDRAVRESLLARALCPALQHAARATAAPAVTIDASQGAATDDADNEEDVAPRSTRQPRAEDSDSDGDDDNEDGDGSDAGGAALEDQRAKKRERVSYDDDTEEATPVPSPDTDGMIKDAQAKKKRGSASSALKFVADVNVRAHASQKDTFTARVKVCMPVSLRRLFMVKMVEDAAARATLREALNIRDCFVVSERGQVSVQTDGVNFEALESYDALLDVDNLQCNDLHAVLRRYGVEAARATVIREVAAVFAVYGIAVDPRHLGLIADYMTFHGGLRPMNRTGIVSCASPLQRVSFETATQFLVAAATAGTVDSLSSPSSAIVVGRPYRGGTSAFEVRCPL